MEMYYVYFNFNGYRKVQPIQGEKTKEKADSLVFKLIIDNAINSWLNDNRMIGLNAKITDIEIYDSGQTILLKQDDWSDLKSIH